MNRASTYRTSVLLFAAFTIAYNLTIAFHELGHSTAVVLDGSRIQDFVLNPFSWSWNLGEGVHNVLFTCWGGVTFGLAYCVLPLLMIRWVRSNSLRLIMKMLAGCAFFINGVYLLVGAQFNFGDGGELLKLGVDALQIIALGTLYLVFAMMIWAELQIYLGLDAHTPFWQRLLVIMGGITPYMILILVYNLLFNPRQIAIWGGFAAIGVFAAILFACSGYVWAKFSPVANKQWQRPERDRYLFLLLAGIILLSEFLIFGTPTNPFNF